MDGVLDSHKMTAASWRFRNVCDEDLDQVLRWPNTVLARAFADAN